jgi:hypothetical protein
VYHIFTFHFLTFYFLTDLCFSITMICCFIARVFHEHFGIISLTWADVTFLYKPSAKTRVGQVLLFLVHDFANVSNCACWVWCFHAFDVHDLTSLRFKNLVILVFDIFVPLPTFTLCWGIIYLWWWLLVWLLSFVSRCVYCEVCLFFGHTWYARTGFFHFIQFWPLLGRLAFSLLFTLFWTPLRFYAGIISFIHSGIFSVALHYFFHSLNGLFSEAKIWPKMGQKMAQNHPRKWPPADPQKSQKITKKSK